MTTVVVAYNEARVIGAANGIPWRLPDDMRFFRETTAGASVVMGHRTWLSLPPRFRPLPGRLNVVVTRAAAGFDFGPTHACASDTDLAACDSVERALGLARSVRPGKEVFVAGGGQIYEYVLAHGLADRVLASEVRGFADVPGDTFFPDLLSLGWVGTPVRGFADFTVVEYLPGGERGRVPGEEGRAD